MDCLENSKLWEQFLGSMSLAEMGKVKLMNRVDTKYVMASARLPELLQNATSEYYVQVADGFRVAMYDTIYFDTQNADYYLMHHNKRLVRQKVRTRQYVHSGECFLEIKNKNNRRRTKKKRIPIGGTHDIVLASDPQAVDFLSGRLLFPAEELFPHLRTRFERITLVNRERTERVTVDTALAFENFRSGVTREMPGIAIVEIKQDGTAVSPMKGILAKMHIHRVGFSKYCIGTALTRPDIKQNNFKERLITIKNIEKNVYISSGSAGI